MPECVWKLFMKPTTKSFHKNKMWERPKTKGISNVCSIVQPAVDVIGADYYYTE